jgi:membrane-associated phospholipid phosphatase
VPSARHADATLFRRVSGTDLTAIKQVGARALRTIDVGSIAFAGGALALVSARRGRWWRAAVVVGSIAAALATTEVLKVALGPLDRTFAPQRGPKWEQSFPSGHATIAMSLALGAIVAAPRVLRAAIAVAGGVYAAGVGISLVALGWHYPSDVVGGYLVAATWAAASLAFLRRRHERPERRRLAVRRERIGLVLAAALAAVSAVVLATTLARHPEFAHALRLRRSTVGTAGVLAVASLALVATTAVLAREPVAT